MKYHWSIPPILAVLVIAAGLYFYEQYRHIEELKTHVNVQQEQIRTMADTIADYETRLTEQTAAHSKEHGTLTRRINVVYDQNQELAELLEQLVTVLNAGSNR